MKEFILGLILGVMIVIGWNVFKHSNRPNLPPQIDTVRVFKPIEKIVRVDSINLRDSVRILDSIKLKDSIIFRDSIIYIPIIQKKYEEPNFTAWVSGYRPNLDSIAIKREIINKRWGVGIVGGVGVTHNNIAPFVGIGVYYRLF